VLRWKGGVTTRGGGIKAVGSAKGGFADRKKKGTNGGSTLHNGWVLGGRGVRTLRRRNSERKGVERRKKRIGCSRKKYTGGSPRRDTKRRGHPRRHRRNSPKVSREANGRHQPSTDGGEKVPDHKKGRMKGSTSCCHFGKHRYRMHSP